MDPQYAEWLGQVPVGQSLQERFGPPLASQVQPQSAAALEAERRRQFLLAGGGVQAPLVGSADNRVYAALEAPSPPPGGGSDTGGMTFAMDMVTDPQTGQQVSRDALYAKYGPQEYARITAPAGRSAPQPSAPERSPAGPYTGTMGIGAFEQAQGAGGLQRTGPAPLAGPAAPPPPGMMAAQSAPSSYTAPQGAPQFQVGQAGIQFGGGQFKWTGSGWHDPNTGRQWDPVGNPVQQQQGTSPAVQYQQSYANPLTDWFKSNSGKDINFYNFNRLKGSTQQLVLGAAEAAGHDKGDVLEDIQRTLPKATGPRSGYVAPLGSR